MKYLRLAVPTCFDTSFDREKQRIETQKLVKKLCLMLAEKSVKYKALQTIILKNIMLLKKEENYLKFIFGFQDKIIIDKANDKYHLTFL